MTAHRSFEDNHLVAHDNAGALVRAWSADETLGLPFVDLFNHYPDLSRLLLPPDDGQQPSPTNL